MLTPAIAAGLCVFLLSYTGLRMIFSDERMVSRRLTGLSTYEAEEGSKANPVLAPFSARVLGPAGRRLSTAAWAITPAAYKRRIERKLVVAGRPRAMTARRFLMLKTTVSASLALLLAASALASGLTPLRLFAVGLAAAVSFVAPDLWLSAKVDERRRSIRRALPDMLDMLTISVEAGLGFDQAVSRLVSSTKGPLAEELGRALQQIQAGGDRSEVLAELGDRCEVEELRTFVASIIQAEVLGVSVSKVLRIQANEMRLVRRQRAEERAQKAPVKLVFPLVSCILPATIIVIMGPAIIRIARAFGLLM